MTALVVVLIAVACLPFVLLATIVALKLIWEAQDIHDRHARDDGPGPPPPEAYPSTMPGKRAGW